MQKAGKCTKKPVKFSNTQSKKAFEKLPKSIQLIFDSELEHLIAYGIEPTIKFDQLFKKAVELKVNGSPAYRCAYKVLNDCIVVLHSFKKTCEGSDKKNMKTVKTRLNSLDSDLFC